ncbi:MAG: AraC family transcriptional regulator [Bacteroidetes bacterium]|nr:AraC family transcriptional regulator [Bacteroidota bacterium]
MMAYSYHNHQQITTFISVENEFLSSLSGLYGEAPSRESIIAIEPTYLLGVHTDVLLGWYEQFFDLNYIIRKVYESYYRDAQERSHMVRVGDAKERYQYFINSRTSDVDRLPIACVASFLNMKPETLIRVKKQLGKEIKPKELENIKENFESYIVKNELFKINDISIKKISKEMKISSEKISYLLTHHYKKSFKDFINKYRIACFKQLIKDENNLQNYTVATIALQAGFSSKSIFYKAFKAQEGISPKNFLNDTKP